MPLAFKQDRGTSGKSRTQADLSRTWIEGYFPAVRSNREILIMNDINVGHHFEKLAGQVGRRAIARRRHRDLAWIRLCVGGGSKIGKFSR